MGAALRTPFLVSLYCWIALEVGLVIRDLVRRKAQPGRDRGTRAAVAISMGGAIFLATLLRHWTPALDTPLPTAFGAAGLVVIWTGLAVRVWAVITLGGAFSTFVQVDTDQAVITSGPYRWVRHPSYTGLVLIAMGFGLGLGNWLSLAACTVVPVLGLLPRIAIEESELSRVLGDQYRSYQKTTRRLVPRVW